MNNKDKIASSILTPKNFTYIVLSMATFLIGSFYFTIFKIIEVERLKKEVLDLKNYAEKTRYKRKQNSRFFQRHLNAPSNYIDKKLKSLLFLDKEKRLLNDFKKHPAYGGSFFIKNHDIEEFQKKNRLDFFAETPSFEQKIKEMHLKQAHPVIINFNDLEKILSRIEEVSINQHFQSTPQPQILIHSFHLKRTDCPLSHLCFELDLEIFQREFSKNPGKKK